MDGLTILYVLLGITSGAVVSCAFLLRKIFYILRQWNNGEPTREDMNNMFFSQMKKK